MSLRKLHAMVKWLPPGNPRDVANERPWGIPEYLLANIFDAINQVSYTIQRVNTGKGTKPKPYPRPGTTAAGKRYGAKSDQVLDQMEIIRRLRALSDPDAGTDKLTNKPG